MKKLSRPASLGVILKSAGITLWISVRTLFEVYTGRFRREIGDRRLRWWSSRLLKYVGVELRVHNPHGFDFEPGTRYIVMCNHRSLYDIPPTFMALSGSIRMLAKKELFKVPVWGAGMRVGEFISIDRRNFEQAVRDLNAAKAKMESGIILWAAPEGTRSRMDELLPFKKGPFRVALDTGAIIVPLGIRGADTVLPARTTRFSYGQPVDVAVGRPIDSRQYAGDLERLMADVRLEIEALAGYAGLP
jgi:1-acyl-sn-glycerol-3-phosphate acyltransferase